MKTHKYSFLAVCVAGTAMVAFISGQNAQAAFTVDITQQGANVVANGSGSINLGALSLSGTLHSLNPFVYGAYGIILLGPSSDYDNYGASISGPTSFGSSDALFASSASGDIVGFAVPGGFALPSGYLSGASLSDSATWDNTTIAGLGLTPGSYTWTWGTLGKDADSFTINIGAVPEPGTYLAGAAMLLPLGLSTLRRLRRQPTA